MNKESTKAQAPASLILSGYPATQHCLAWSNEGLAVASGENIHFLTLQRGNETSDNEGPPRLATDTIRANLFTNAEWPQIDPATIRHLSLGEEQSDSYYTNIDWSPPGLGVYRRSVLAVLTSNLILQLWETDGTPGQWKKTCIVNHYLPTSAQKLSTAARLGPRRRELRIRAFAWAPILKTVTDPKWGLQHLAVVDDAETLFVFRINKDRIAEYGAWQVEIVSRIKIPSAASDSARSVSPLQKILSSQSPVDAISFSAWQEGVFQKALSTVIIKRVHHKASQMLPVEIDLSNQQERIVQVTTSKGLSARFSSGEHTGRVWESSLPQIIYNYRSLPEWRSSLRDICDKFDKAHNLDGKYRIRLWGTARGFGNCEALCITLHPFDMYEYTTAVMEKCRLVFRVVETADSANTKPSSDIHVLHTTVELVRQLQRSAIGTTSETDVKISRLFAAAAEVVQSLDQNSGSSDPVDGAIFAQWCDQQPSSEDNCEICNSGLRFFKDITTARCTQGHIFPRCNISLMAIQSPGISKYCSSCNRQYIDPDKISIPQGPSLTRALFDAFDACPYCRGKFRRI